MKDKIFKDVSIDKDNTKNGELNVIHDNLILRNFYINSLTQINDIQLFQFPCQRNAFCLCRKQFLFQYLI